jgi:hypothetical protein
MEFASVSRKVSRLDLIRPMQKDALRAHELEASFTVSSSSAKSRLSSAWARVVSQTAARLKARLAFACST